MAPFRRDRFDPAAVLAAVVTDEQQRIVRLWAKRLRGELHEVDVPGRDLKAPLEGIVRELGRLLRDRGEEALWLFPEAVREHGVRRYEQRFDVEDVAAEMKALQGVLLRVCTRVRGGIEPELAELISELVGEAAAGVHAAYARALRTEEVRFREAAVMESVLQHVDVGILLLEVDGTISYATPAVTRLVGLPVRALVGAKATETLRLVLEQVKARHPDGRPFKASEMPWRRALEEKRSVDGVWMAFDHVDGRERTVEMAATPLLDDPAVPGGERKPWGVIQTLTDRTALAQRTQQQQLLVQRASDVAHALNNVLNVVTLRVTQLKKDVESEQVDEVDRLVKQMAEHVARLHRNPAAGPETAPPPEPAPLPARTERPPTRRVLIVDDDLENAQVMAEVLGEEGYYVRVAHDGRTALWMWKSERFDTALVDVIMPDMSGWDLAAKLRDEHPGASIAIVTGTDVRVQNREALSKVDAVFRKPVDVAALDEFLSGAAVAPVLLDS